MLDSAGTSGEAQEASHDRGQSVGERKQPVSDTQDVSVYLVRAFSVIAVIQAFDTLSR